MPVLKLSRRTVYVAPPSNEFAWFFYNIDSTDFNCMQTSEMEIIWYKKGKVRPRTGHEDPVGE
jgi:hypothetical protein